MSNPNPDAEIQGLLRMLTERQSQILYWFCQGLTRPQMAEKIGKSPGLVKSEIATIYETLGLSDLTREQRRLVMLTVVCPIHIEGVAEPKTAYKDRVIEIGEPSSNPAMEQIVEADERAGMIPLDRSLVRRQPMGWTKGNEEQPEMGQEQSDEQGTRRQGGGMVPVGRDRGLRGGGQGRQQRTGCGQQVLLVLLGIISTLLFVVIVIMAFLYRDGRLVLTGNPQANLPASVVTVVITQPPQIITLPPQIITSPPMILTSAPITVLQTVVVTAPPIVLTAIPVPAVLSPIPSPNSGPIDLAGKVPNDIPGYVLTPGVLVSSVIDENTKIRDVYNMQLVAGKDVRIELTLENTFSVHVYLLNPGSKSIDTGQYVQAWEDNPRSGGWRKIYTPASTGTYYFGVKAQYSGQRYTLTIYTSN